MRKIFAGVLVLSFAAVAGATSIPPFTELQAPELGEAKGDVRKPTEIGSAEELEKAIPDAEARAAIAKQIDFKQSKLLWFQWAGSGGDKLTAEAKVIDKKGVVVFSMQRGRTRDLRQHHKLFAVATGLEWQVRDGRE